MNESAVHYRFGRFQFILPQLTLTRDGEPVKLGGRALNLLAVLAEANGSLVTRSSLLEQPTACWSPRSASGVEPLRCVSCRES